ncbi:unnamed protein product, partial [Discosporangium mesarthrocarpum]
GAGSDLGRGCQVIHVRIKRYSLEEVMGNTHWLDDRWADKERLLSHFAQQQSFPSDGRGFPARRTLDTHSAQLEGSAVALLRLLVVPPALPMVLLVAMPIVVAMAGAAVVYRLCLAALGAVARRVLPKGWAQRFRVWNEGDTEDEEEDELGHAYSSSRATTPWWGGPTTPLNTPAPGPGAVNYVAGAGRG